MTAILLICFISETIMFLHQIFYQGLKARIASWPTLVLGKRDSDDASVIHKVQNSSIVWGPCITSHSLVVFVFICYICLIKYFKINAHEKYCMNEFNET